MKAVIVELRGKYAAALSDDGCVRRVKNEGYMVGQPLELKTAGRTGSKLALRIAGLAAALAVIAVPAYAYCAPYSYVSLDVNPSIEYSLNRFDRVLRCTAVNGEGAEVLEGLELRGERIGDAIRLTLSAIAEEGYMTAEEPCGIMITASSKDEEKSSRLAETLAETALKAASDKALEVEVEAEAVGQARVQEAKGLGVTPGKLNLIEKLQESAADDTQVAAQDWLDKPVKDIMEQTKENRKSENTAESGKGNSNPNNGKQTSSPELPQEHPQSQKPNGHSRKGNSNGKSS